MSLAETIASTASMRQLFSDRASVQALLDVEAALAVAGASAGFFSVNEAAAIGAACKAEAVDIEQLTRDAALAGTVVIPLVNWLKAAVPTQAKFVHLGGTSQDIIDTALVLQLRNGVALLQADLSTIAAAAAGLARAHAATPMLARTLLQAALPMSFGLKTANWLVAVNDSRRAIDHAASVALLAQCGGAAGAHDAIGNQAGPFLTAFSTALNLPLPATPWHTRRAPLARLAAAIAGAAGAAGKIGTDIALSMQSEVAELSEPAAPGRGGSSAMAHKRNPTLSIAARAAAVRMPGFVAALFAAMDQEHERAAGGWQAETATWPALMLCASGGLAAMAEATSGLIVHAERMAENLRLAPPEAVSKNVAEIILAALADHQNYELRRS
jgi:3-carboxy-cis,cis-muconate cycloisomerase